MATYFSEAWSKLFNPQSVIPFLVGSLALAVLGNATFSLLAAWLGNNTPGLLLIVGITAGMLLVSVLWLRWWLFRAMFEPTELPHPRPLLGLVLLVSTADIADRAILYHRDTL